eukprot:TRINITY_DN5768_c4_g1_i1.p1 TRINITY_DN5768_c4_g1~~TRINITY_DN5768_c4_g1_i1.p1  ORF type:complete len:532 (+),score=141.94 TRINITY_DN5768_c4_g1_i1:162-1757(+)
MLATQPQTVYPGQQVQQQPYAFVLNLPNQGNVQQGNVPQGSVPQVPQQQGFAQPGMEQRRAQASFQSANQSQPQQVPPQIPQQPVPPILNPQLIQQHQPPQLQPGSPHSPHSPVSSGYSSPTNSQLGSPKHMKHKPVPKKPAASAPLPPDTAAQDVNEEDIANMPPSVKRPCVHNDWDDVRTRKGSKILRCRTCQRKWKLPSSHVPRCLPFLRGHCPNDSCHLLHVHKKKSGLMERYEQFGEAVLRAMPPLAKQAAEDAVAERELHDVDTRRESIGSEHPSLLSEDIAVQQRRASIATSISEPPSLITERRASVAFSTENSIHDRRASLFSEMDYRRTSIISETGGLGGGLMSYDPTRRCSTVSELDGARRAAILSDLEAIRKGPTFGDGGMEGLAQLVTRRRVPLPAPSVEVQAMESYRLGEGEPNRQASPSPSPPPEKDTDSLAEGLELYSPPGSRKSSTPGIDSRRSSVAVTSPTTSPVPSPTAGEPAGGSKSTKRVVKKKGKDNEGVHAMSEAELDEHIKKHFGQEK